MKQNLFVIAIGALMSLFSQEAAAGIWGEGGIFSGRGTAVPPGLELDHLATLSSDRDNQVGALNVMLDGNNQVMGLYTRAQSVTADSSDIVWLRDIESPEGAVLAESDGKKVLILKGRLNRETQEGRFQIHYLANGLWKRYESCDFHLRRSAGDWYVENVYNNSKVDAIKVLTWSLGVTTLEGICPPKAR
jgi:hypothetical protein